MKIKPIETTYKGYRFRSRLEARWAVFLDSFNEPWEYEVEGYALPSGCYLPDFWLPRLYCWLEIKGEKPTDEENRLCVDLAYATDRPVAIAWGLPRIPKPGTVYHEHSQYWEDVWLADGLKVFCNDLTDGSGGWNEWGESFWAIDEDGELCICSNNKVSSRVFVTPASWESFPGMKLVQEIREPISETHVNTAKRARFEFER